MNGSDPKLQWLDDARELARALVSEPVERVRGRGRGDRGIASSTVGEVVAFLQRHRDLTALDRFLGLYPKLDRAWAQNQNNQKAERGALARVLREERRRSPERGAEAWLLVLAWARQLMTVETPTRPPNHRPAPSDGGSKHEPPRTRGRRERDSKQPTAFEIAMQKAEQKKRRRR